MDQDLIAYLDRRFNDISLQVSSLREESAQRFGRLETRLEMLESRFDARLDAFDARLDAFDARLEAVETRLEAVEDGVRHTQVMIEDLRHQIQVLAEGFVGLHDRVDRFQAEATLVFDQVKGWIEPYYRNLNDRVRVMEGQAERRFDDVMDSVRRILGKKPFETSPAG